MYWIKGIDKIPNNSNNKSNFSGLFQELWKIIRVLSPTAVIAFCLGGLNKRFGLKFPEVYRIQ